MKEKGEKTKVTEIRFTNNDMLTCDIFEQEFKKQVKRL